MTHETFQRLVANVKRDNKLTSVPFAVQDPDGVYAVLSGNHRVKAAIEAELEEIELMVTDDQLSDSQRKAIQLSHNSIAGEDDPEVLKRIFESIEDVDMKLYTGLDDKVLDLLTNVDIVPLTDPRLDFRSLSFIFFPSEIEHVEQVLRRAASSVVGDVMLARMEEWPRVLDALAKSSMAHGIHNAATALLIVLEVFERHEEDLRDGWLDKECRAKHTFPVPMSNIFLDDTIPAESAATVIKAVQLMLNRGEIDKAEMWEAIEIWAKKYLDGDKPDDEAVG